MSRQWKVPGGGYINATGSRQWKVSGAGYVNESDEPAGASADLVLTYNVAARVPADLTLIYNVVVAGGPVEADLELVYNVAARVTADFVLTYNVLPAGASITSDVFELNTGTPYTTETAHYSWLPGGRTGALAGITPVEGSKALVAGALTVTGLVAGPGMLKACVRGATAKDDAEFLQHLTAV